MSLNLSRRETAAMALAGALMSLFLVLHLAVFPLLNRHERMERRVAAKRQVLAEVADLKSEYESLVTQAARSRERFSARPPGFTLYSFLERLAADTGLKDSIAYMKPSTIEAKDNPFKRSQVEVKLQDVGLENLAAYLYRIETAADMVSIRRLSIIRKGDESAALNAVLQVETPEL